MATTVAEHNVVLLAPSGKEQVVILRITRAGIQLATAQENRDINKFPYEVIKKWLPASLRSRNPGPDDCLDLQIETDRGTRDLRMRCASTTAVRQIITELKDTVLDIMREMEGRQFGSAGGAAAGATGGSEGSGRQTNRPAPRQAPADSGPSSDGSQAGPETATTGVQTQTQGAAMAATSNSAAGAASRRASQAGAAGTSRQPSTSAAGIQPPASSSRPGSGSSRASAGDTVMQGTTTAAQAAALQELAAIPGAIPVQLLQTSSSAAFATSSTTPGSPIALQHDQQAPIMLALPAPGTAPGLLPHVPQQQPIVLLPQGALALVQPGTAGSVPLLLGSASQGSNDDDDLQVAGRVESYGPAYMNAAFNPAALLQQQQPQQQSILEQRQQQQQQQLRLVGGAGLSASGGPRHSSFTYYPTLSAAAVPGTTPVQGAVGPGGSVSAGGGYAGAAPASTGASTGAPAGPPQHNQGGLGAPQRQEDMPPHYQAPYGSRGSPAASSGSPGSPPPGADSLHAQLQQQQSLQHKQELSELQALAARAAAEAEGARTAATGAGARAQRAELRAAELETQLADLKEQNSFLEGLVRRLSTELSTRQAAAGESGALTETELLVSGLDDGAPLPAWLKDRRYLNPLLAAYDDRIAALEAETAAQVAAAAVLAKQVEDVVSENERLRAEVSKANEASNLAALVAAGPNGSEAASVLLREENELLRQENDLLVAQQSQLDAEMRRLHGQLEAAASAEASRAAEHTAAMARASAAVETAQEAEAKRARMASAMSAAEARANRLAQELNDVRSQLEDAQVTAETAAHALAQLQAAQASLEAEAAAAARRARAATEAEIKAQAEAASLRDQHHSVVGEAENARREAERLREALKSIELKLAEYQRRDAEVYSRVREAMEAAEEAAMARDSSAARARELEAEVTTLTERLASVRKATRDQVHSEFQSKVHGLESELAASREATRQAEAQAAEHKATADRNAREVASLSAELAALKEDLGETLSSKSRVTLMSLSTMERIQEVERERDEAAQQLESRTRQLERLQREWMLEKQGLENEVRLLRKAQAELEGALTLARGEAAGYARQGEALGREVATLREAKARGEAELRQQVAAARAERDTEVKAMAGRLESALAACARSVSEAERMLEAKESLLARWREEAQMIAGKLERALSDHRHELEVREGEAEDLRLQVGQLQEAHAAALGELGQLRAALPDLQASLSEAEGRAAQLHMQVLAAGTREEELSQEVRSLHALLERARFEGKRSDRGRDALAAKFEALRRAGVPADAVVGVTAVPRTHHPGGAAAPAQ